MTTPGNGVAQQPPPTTGVNQNQFHDVVKKLNSSHPGLPERFLSLSTDGQAATAATTDRQFCPTPGNDAAVNDVDTAKKEQMDVSKLMAFSSSLASFAYNKPEDLTSGFPSAVKESFTDGTTIQHFNTDALAKCFEYVVSIQLMKVEIEGTKGTFNPLLKDIDPYLAFNHGTSVVTFNIIKDVFAKAGSPSHYLLIRKKAAGSNSATILKGNILDKDPLADPTKSAASFDKAGVVCKNGVVKSRVNLDSTSNDQGGNQTVTQTSPTTVLVKTLQDKKITITCSIKVEEAQDFVRSFAALALFGLDKYAIGIPRNPQADCRTLYQDVGIQPIDIFPVAYVDQHKTATQAWLFCNSDNNTLVLAFPGTDVIDDVKEDSGTSSRNNLVELGGIKVAKTKGLTWTGNLDDTERVHEGYRDAYLSVRDALLETMCAISDGWSDKYSIIVTGHSLGGSLAGIAAFDIANREKDSNQPGTKPALAMFTFAAPAVANDSLVTAFSKSVPYGFRVVLDADKVAKTMYNPLKRLGSATPWGEIQGPLTSPVVPGAQDDTPTSWNDVLNLSVMDMFSHTTVNYINSICTFLKNSQSPQAPKTPQTQD